MMISSGKISESGMQNPKFLKKVALLNCLPKIMF